MVLQVDWTGCDGANKKFKVQFKALFNFLVSQVSPSNGNVVMLNHSDFGQSSLFVKAFHGGIFRQKAKGNCDPASLYQMTNQQTIGSKHVYRSLKEPYLAEVHQDSLGGRPQGDPVLKSGSNCNDGQGWRRRLLSLAQNGCKAKEASSLIILQH